MSITFKEANRRYTDLLMNFTLHDERDGQYWKKLRVVREGGFAVVGRSPTKPIETHSTTLSEAVELYNNFNIKETK